MSQLRFVHSYDHSFGHFSSKNRSFSGYPKFSRLDLVKKRNCKSYLNMTNNQIDRNIIFSTTWNNNISIFFRWSAIFIIRRLDKSRIMWSHDKSIGHMTTVLPCILFDNVFNGSSSFGSVSFDSSGQSCISITINKQFHIAKFSNLFVMKQHNPLDQNNFSWLNKLKVTSATMILDLNHKKTV